jgi:deoxycytidine triphosphate deaminase
MNQQLESPCLQAGEYVKLEIKNNGHVPIRLEYGMHICQIRFAYLASRCDRGYEGKYTGSTDTTGAI